MSELMEKVRDVIAKTELGTGQARDMNKARAAIKAAAEWLQSIDYSDTDLARDVAKDLLAQLEAKP